MRPAATPVAAAVTRYPFVPYGLVPLVGLVLLIFVALVPFAFGEVQSVTETSARKALASSGANWASASASGQWVILEGRPPSREAAEQAIAAVQAATAETMFGQAAPATWVIEHFTWAEDPLRPGRLLPPDETSPEDPDIAAVPPPTEDEAALCDSTMAALLSRARIEFPTGDASIAAGNVALLGSIAEAASDCVGVLRIEGHTDNVGKDASNAALSLRRAEAVRAALIVRGVAPARLVAKGYGAASPLANNDTADGRARNRRIEIRSVRASPN
jgi:outer membrane protein OmpA-like peptidoglycan-associated protein